MFSFLSRLAKTENNDIALKTSGSPCLDFFTRITRNSNPDDFVTAFEKAWAENHVTAIQLLFNLRDIRGGKGEKFIPCSLLFLLKLNLSDAVYREVLSEFIKLGCWKDVLRVTELNHRYHRVHEVNPLDYEPGESPIDFFRESCAELDLMAEQLKKDIVLLASGNFYEISLCAKWAPTEGTRYGKKPFHFVNILARKLGMNNRSYRKTISELRSNLKVLETLMSAHRFEEIDFKKLPSVAMTRGAKYFNRNKNASGKESEARQELRLAFEKFKRDLAEKKASVNAGAVHPHEIINKVMSDKANAIVYEAAWTKIRDSVKETGVFSKTTAIVDVSGSMHGTPMDVAIALGLLVSDCTRGLFHGKVITFHESPSYHFVTGDNLRDRAKCLSRAEWGGHTDLRKVFDLILQDAKSADLSSDEMIETLFIFTDMQFNGPWEATRGDITPTMAYGKKSFEEAGYPFPRIVCWNLRTSASKTLVADQNEHGVVMLSGFSHQLLKYVLKETDFNPIAMMNSILSQYPIEFNLASEPARLETQNQTQLINVINYSK